MSKKIKSIVFVLAALIVVNFISNQFFKRFDVTKDKRYTLSEVSKNIITDLDRNLIINVYLEGSFPSEFQRLQIETRQFLEELQSENSHVRFRFVNPEGMEQELVKNGMTPSQLTVEEDGKLSESIIFPWAEVFYGKKSQVVSLLPNTMATSQESQLQNAVASLEHSFANAIDLVLQKEKKKIAVLSGNGELDDIKIFSLLTSLKDKYLLDKISLDSVEKNPTKTLKKLKEFDLSIVAKPTERFSDKEKLVLDQYAINGGKMLWMLDNLSADTDSLYNQGKMLALPRDLNLTDLLFSYGVRVNNKLVQDVYASKLTLVAGNVGNQPQFESYDWFYHPLAGANPNHPITKNILPVRFRFTTQIDTLKKPIKKTPLIVSSVSSKLLGTPRIIELESITEAPIQEEYTEGNQLLAVLLEGEFHSAYENRTTPFDLTDFKKVSSPSKMIVVADGDIARNQILKGKPYDLGLDKWTQQRFGNKDFLLNSIEYLLDDTGLIDLRNRSVQLRMLDKQKAYKEKGFWQVVNIVVPLALLFLFGFGFNYIRKRKYQ
ncbi:gliding motility-associated ABC transporter substrate-binding protein GldG [Tenacibaculum sp. M341]|uniref:gliding motility-associated ABC transporter substrate-binding protein GldG n=1 Tax=Tenacibaculum sp. M341 TaxID=2530339 RepID=UPI001052ADC3|nr:gliding motility-associated ABC transporter substrate-binding protein GldG [Tenacibaculum sp. M341]TCI84651.1 gliding motility-associated ABC transporter substrate-binding protein GldG [Tenacibaculum sp. M341]